MIDEMKSNKLKGGEIKLKTYTTNFITQMMKA